ncbi:mitogen-activated protein kinase kinase kinase 4-like [Oratosquilla oratoria]|uniref:mitogen-activated protein kinase kinase kinase 4-like n=1 Tax=Oratosquilla oratoria TaxID=337810 RepID=UPI003F757C19
MSNDDKYWRNRLGLTFEIDIPDSDIEDEPRTTQGGKVEYESDSSVDEPETSDSFTNEEEELENILNQFGRTPPRTIRHRRQKERDAYCTNAKEAAKTMRASLKRRRTAERFLSLPGFPEHDSLVLAATPERTRPDYQQRKRSQDRLRTLERQTKHKVVESFSLNAFTTDPDDRCESLPPFSPIRKVCQMSARARYKSISYHAFGIDSTDGERTGQAVRKTSILELPRDRVAFHSCLSNLVKLGNQEPPIPQRQSEEEELYRKELNENIWLELQAWHAGQECDDYDGHLLVLRQKVPEVIEEVMQFEFNSLNWSLETVVSNDKESVNQDSVEKISTVDDLVSLGDLVIGGKPVRRMDEFDGRGQNKVGDACGESCQGCLSIWCECCKEQQTKALIEVEELLQKLEFVESLFPSTSKLADLYSDWLKPEFIGRYKALCVWYNATVQLRLKIELLGKLLGHMTNSLMPWPTFTYPKIQSLPNVSHDSGILTGEIENSTPKKSKHQAMKPPVVRFTIEADDCCEENQYSNPSDSQSSTDSGATNTSSGSALLLPPQPFTMPSGGLKRCMSDIFVEANPYRKYVEKLLRNKGMKKTFDKLAEVIRDVTSRTIYILEESQTKNVPSSMLTHFQSAAVEVPSSALVANLEDLRQYGPWTQKFTAMGLPSFYAAFIFLNTVPLQMMRECLKLRLEQMPDKPSRLSIKQLMREYKEGVKFAVIVRQKYLRSCQALFWNLNKELRDNLECRLSQAIEELDGNMKRMLEVYLEWLDQFVLMLHREPQMSGLQRNFLQEEWIFIKATCPHVVEGESLAATMFCNIACHMLCSVGDFVDTGIDDLIVGMQDSSLEATEDMEEVFQQDPEDHQRHLLLQLCRDIQVLILEARERALRAASLAKMLRKDLEVAAEFSLNDDYTVVFAKLQETGHIRVKAPHSQNHYIFIPGNIKEKRDYIWQLLDMRVGAGEEENWEEEGYLVLMKGCESQNTEELWKGQTIVIEPTADCTITLSRVDVIGLLLVVATGPQLVPIRKDFMHCMGSTLQLQRDQTTPNKAITHSMDEMKNEALKLCKNLASNIKKVESMADVNILSSVSEADKKQIHQVTRDIVHQCFKFGFEYHKEVTRLVTGHHRIEVASLLVTFASQWMKFVHSHYSPGKGQRPLWANPGLEFIVFVSDAHNTRHISQEFFQMFKQEVSECCDYIVGVPPPTTPQTPVLSRRPFRTSSSSSQSNPHPERSISQQSSESSPTICNTDSPLLRRHILKMNQISFERQDTADGEKIKMPIERIREKIEAMENEILEYLVEEKVIGKVSSTKRDKIHIKPRTVSFSWHRGFKIGAGRYGKVYTAINNNSGDLMALKVIQQMQPNQSFRKFADEMDIIEGVSHPHLVKYYGTEIHPEEMLIFMEYCDEGTLEELAQSTETGLPEVIVRKYTRQLLEGINCLHDHGILHRDIKGANIFLTQEGNILKLGDFGCSVRIRGFQTEVGEFSGIVGTHAYMAPEIFRSSEGHGRAADIWSLGCVVIEMATGKRPWPEYDNSAQIMFRVGMGQSPSIPETLSEEGYDFLGRCFVHDPGSRASSAELLDHTFVKVDVGDEYTSLPLFSHPPVVPHMEFMK